MQLSRFGRSPVLDHVAFENFKSLKSVEVELSPMTVLVGPNGSGKSSVLAGIHLLSQTGMRQHGGEPSAKSAETPRRSDPQLKWGRFGAIFAGPRDPRRLASQPPPTKMSLSMSERGGDRITLVVDIPAGADEQPELVRFSVAVAGAEGLLEAFRPPGGARFRFPEPGTGLDHPRVRRFASVVYLHLDAAAMTRTSTTDEVEPRMAADGEGLASTLAWMAGAKPDTLQAIASDLGRVVPGVRRILTHREKVNERVMESLDVEGQPVWRTVDRVRVGDRFSIEFDDGSEIPADLLSEGTVLALGLLTKLHEPGRPRVVLLDDIDRGLHIAAQAKLVEVLRDLMKLRPDLQIVCSTHSTYLLNLFEPAEVRVLALDEHRGTHARKLTDHPEFEKWRYGAQTGELWAALGDAWVTVPAQR